ncbi:MAG: FtsX-like permease family protein [Flavobacteriales bacterium]|nr:FtsX-like permease family protein [Flavobacteriales bacterium]
MIVRFIASRMAGKGEGTRLSKPVVVIATAGIAIGVALMILSVAIVTGFQQEVRDKVVGFGAHYQIVNAQQSFNKESSRVLKEQDFYPELADLPGIRHVQVFATKPGIMETTDNLQGCIIKGVGQDFDWSFFEDKIVKGDSIRVDGLDASKDIMISAYTARRLGLEIDDKVTLYFVLQEGNIKPRNFAVSAIYSTGLKEFDEQFVFVDIAHIQRINQWGIEAQILVSDSCIDDGVMIEGLGFGGQRDLRYEWIGTPWQGSGPHTIYPEGEDFEITLVVSDKGATINDTAWVTFTQVHPDSLPCGYTYELRTTGGSRDKYVGGFEVLIENYDDLNTIDELLYDETPYNMQLMSVTDRNPEIFSWLEMLDLNVELIIYMMILIAVVNMTSALLIIILERTNMIGLLKAFGMNDRDIMQVFVRHAARIIGIGLLVGNLLGIGLALLQQQTKLITLNPESYYVKYVPIKFDWMYLLQIEVITFVICVVMMLIPALYVAKISPVKAIRFD